MTTRIEIHSLDHARTRSVVSSRPHGPEAGAAWRWNGRSGVLRCGTLTTATCSPHSRSHTVDHIPVPAVSTALWVVVCRSSPTAPHRRHWEHAHHFLSSPRWTYMDDAAWSRASTLRFRRPTRTTPLRVTVLEIQELDRPAHLPDRARKSMTPRHRSGASDRLRVQLRHRSRRL